MTAAQYYQAMRRTVKRPLILLAIGTALTFSGCASMWKAMGVATVASVNDVNAKVDAVSAKVDDSAKGSDARLAELKATIDDLSTKMDDLQKSKDDISRIDSLVGELQGKIDQLPHETLRQLAEILAKAADETPKASK